MLPFSTTSTAITESEPVGLHIDTTCACVDTAWVHVGAAI